MATDMKDWQAEHGNEPGKTALWKRAILWLLGVVLLGAMVWGVVSLISSKPGPKKPAVTTIKILPDTPPPPPPPPKEPPKEQPKEEPKEIKVEQPKPVDAPPEPQNLKMEGDAGDAPSAFGAGKVNSDYSGGDVGVKIGGNKSLAAYAWYTGKIKRQIEEAIATQPELAREQYKLVVSLWLDKDGRVERLELQSSTGDQKKDDLLRKALQAITRIAEAPPDDMPQPVKLRITAKSAG
ncbi:TonB C-terminal domain-containing protein [Methylobacillus gramineus]|uniref:TonB C-terminal domain-containing protein n=1 Tax=Methylobacillus gramineus TaxID=755169 RepID=UPI001CFFB598|nr:TonB C-terminal domain-containing protein [Methylobacillus gramineus]MCB5186046.1 TonB C-terminal domain-containing protein [Methylobacillus gramineus]